MPSDTPAERRKNRKAVSASPTSRVRARKAKKSNLAPPFEKSKPKSKRPRVRSVKKRK